jgi:glutaredoxin
MGPRLLATALIACVMLLRPVAVGAQDKAVPEPIVYFFWSASCPYSKAARAFLLAQQAKDAALAIREYEVDQSLPNSNLLGRLYDKVGLPGTRAVPTIVIGSHIIIGFIDDGSTGRDILDAVEDCRKTACKDAVQGLIEVQDRLDADVGSLPPKRIACEREPGQAVR